MDKVDISELENTKQFLQTGNMIVSIIGATFEVILSNMQYVAYVAMIFSMIFNSGLVALVYPLAVFGYALIEEHRPNPKFWHFMLRYTLCILFLKFFL